MLKKFSNGCVRIMNRWLPDPFLFAIILTIVVFIAACLGTQQSPWEMIWAWGGKGKGGDGMWGLLAFSMQMALVLVLGSALASAKVCKKILNSIAGLAKSKMSAIVVVTAVSTLCCWLNWGFGLIVGALLAWYETGFTAAFPGVFLFNALSVGISELLVCCILGLPLLAVLTKTGIFSKQVVQ